MGRGGKNASRSRNISDYNSYICHVSGLLHVPDRLDQGDRGEALREGFGQLRGPQQPPAEALHGGPAVQDRPLPGQGDGPELDQLAVWQHDLWPHLEQGPHCQHHHQLQRALRDSGPGRVLWRVRDHPGRDAEPPPTDPLPRCHGETRVDKPRRYQVRWLKSKQTQSSRKPVSWPDSWYRQRNCYGGKDVMQPLTRLSSLLRAKLCM